ncbi:ATP-binding protein [Chitinophaga pendula]|uniref:ATP-binding protein n=1 Tax=Chitinophaga TaxID=79328 RepID=UPI000BB04DBC|nr:MULTISPECIES: ATP-binding protein [Chitinophaga]ASZ11072.1 hypothetical protein CK934_08920 [Chitinophaga sp. MD30]UCJ05930.1 ATP-binding protein [Chitinophaga pendula]
MNNEIKLRIAEALEIFIQYHGLSLNELSQRAKINIAYLSSIQKRVFEASSGKGKVATIANKWFVKIAEFIGFDIENTYWQPRTTDQLKQILAHLEEAKNLGTIKLLIGETGSGKTFISDLFAKNHPSDLFKIKIGASDNLGDILDKILEKLNVTPARTKSKKIQAITGYMRELKLQGRKPCLILDECEYMKQSTLSMVKELLDELITYCSIILLATDQLRVQIEKLVRKNKPGMPQLYRRIKFSIVNLARIDRQYKAFLDGYAKDVKTLLIDLCDNYGELHDILMPVLRESARTGDAITVELIQRVHGFLRR